MLTPFRLIFIVLAGAAIFGTSYVSYRGYGSESWDLDRSIRAASAGRLLNRSVK